jgi:hypothetical protein
MTSSRRVYLVFAVDLLIFDEAMRASLVCIVFGVQPPSLPSKYCGRAEFMPGVICRVAANEGDLNEDDCACRGYRRKEVFAQAVMPEFVHGKALTNQYKATNIESKLNESCGQPHANIAFNPVRSMQHGKGCPAQ